MSNKGAGTTAGERDQNRRLVPKLRFPEFRNAGDWQNTTIGEVGTFYYGKSAPKWSLEVNALTKCVRYGELYTKFGPVISQTFSRTNIEPKNLRFSKGGEILVPRVGEKPEDFGRFCSYLTLPNVAIGEMISVFETDQNPLFYTYYFRKMYKEFAQVVEGQNVKNLYYSELEPLAIGRPTKPEQRKIADCLSSIDALIATEAERLEALNGHKKGLLQQLFPAPGETAPRLRFPEFREDAHWMERPLGEICEVAQGYGFPEVRQGKSRGDYPFCKVSDISRAVSENGGILSSATNYVDHADLKILRAKTVPAGATVFAKIGEALRLNRRAITGVECLIDNNAVALKAKSGVASDYFIFLLSQMIDMNEHCGGAVPSVNKSTLEGISVIIPPPKEQEKIAGFFSSFDVVIALQTAKLGNFRAHRTGLTQQLFAAADEVKV